MRTLICCVASMSVVLVSCAESVHQEMRMAIESGSYQAPSAQESSGTSAEPENVTSAGGTPSLYARLNAETADHQGRLITVSGTVLKAKRLNGLTEIEILHLPTGTDGRPTEDRRKSQGRFLAKQTTTFLDPAILATGPMVTVLGVLEGEVERPLEPGADNYSYPVLAIQQLNVWPHELLQPHVVSRGGVPGGADLARSEATTDFALNFLGAVLNGIVQAIFTPERHDHGRSSASSSSSHSSPPPGRTIPPQFQKNRR